MTAQLIDGIAVSKLLRQEISARTVALKSKNITPGLAVIRANETADGIDLRPRIAMRKRLTPGRSDV